MRRLWRLALKTSTEVGTHTAPSLKDRLDAAGYLVVESVVAPTVCDEAVLSLQTSMAGRPGSRTLLNQPWCGSLASRLMAHPVIASLLPHEAVPVQCTLFDKAPENNWLVTLHQDLSIPVAERVASGFCTGWSEKEGMTFVQPPLAVLEQLLAVRLHLDECNPENGPLRVVPGSHRNGKLSAFEAARLRGEHGEVVCEVPRGGVLVMRPLLLHASSKSSAAAPRRVLHFVFGPPSLPCGLRWPLPPWESSAEERQDLDE